MIPMYASSVAFLIDQRPIINPLTMRFKKTKVGRLRARARAQLNLPIYGSWGLAAYDEILIPLNGENKYFQGLNENRFGTGLRYKSEKLEVLLYHTQAFVKSLRTETYPQWIQLQTIYLF